MIDKINVSQIIVDHVRTLRSDATGKVHWSDYLLFLLIPSLVSVLPIYFQTELKESAVTLLMAAFSIFAGLLINVLVLIYTVAIRLEDSINSSDEDRYRLERDFIKQIFANVSFSILISVLIVLILFVSSVSPKAINIAGAAVCTFLIVEFTLTLLMSLKRLHVLLANRIGPE